MEDKKEGDNGCMTADRLPEPIIVHLPYADIGNEETTWESVVNPTDGAYASVVEKSALRYIFNYPTVYVVHSEKQSQYRNVPEYTVYVGETNNIKNRTFQHLRSDPNSRDDWKEFQKKLEQDPRSVWQYVIGNEHFNKSLTLDIENKLMHYLLGSDAVKNLNNRRTNAQGDYYTQDEFDRIFSDIWLGLHQQDSTLFPSEQIIRDSALFKASPFHQLSDDQMNAETAIMNAIADVLSDFPDSSPSRLIFVQGAAGTGKTVVLSHLFYRISTELGVNGHLDDEDDEDLLMENRGSSFNVVDRRKAYILVNHEQQVHVYNQIATKLGLQKKSDEVVLKPSQFINKFSEKKPNGRGIPDRPQGKADIVLVDEAHLLLTQGNQGYSGKNMLHDLLRRSRVVVAVFDPNQILQNAQQWKDEDLQALFPHHELDKTWSSRDAEMEPFERLDRWGGEYLFSHIRLSQQFRIAADESTIQWVDDFAGGVRIGKWKKDLGEKDPKTGKYIREPYIVKVFDSPVELFKAIKEKAKLKAGGVDGHGLSRVVATYDWSYTGVRENPDSPDGLWNVEMFCDAEGQWHMGLGLKANRGYNEKTSDDDPNYFCHPWNYQIKPQGKEKSLSSDQVWAEASHTINEVGSTFSIQGFDLNYVGVIIGPSVAYRDGQIVFDKSKSCNANATNLREKEDYSQKNLRNELNVLLKRGVHGLYLFAVDPELQAVLKKAIGE